MSLVGRISRSDVEGFNAYRIRNPDTEIVLSSEVFGPGLTLDHINLSCVDLRNSRFVDNTIVGGMFCGADLRGSVFVECFLEDALFRQAYLTNVVFVRCDLEGTDFVNVNIDREEGKNYKMWFVETPLPHIQTYEEIRAMEGISQPAIKGSYKLH